MGYVGGQALIEGVMMKGDKYISRAVYTPSGNLIVDKKEFISFGNRFPIFKLPILRGFVSLLEMMVLGMNSLMYSINIASPDEEQVSKKEMTSSMFFSILLSILLFIILPATFFNFLRVNFTGINIFVLSLCEGLFRMTIFVGFLLSTLFMKDMKNVYQYHGAEHKAVNAFEDKANMTVEEVKKYSRIHTRCGTSYIMVVLLVSIIVFAIIGKQALLTRIFFKLLLFPLISGISYEFIRLAAKFNHNMLLKIFLLPGLLLQLITTIEPNDKQIAAAISAIKEVT